MVPRFRQIKSDDYGVRKEERERERARRRERGGEGPPFPLYYGAVRGRSLDR